MISLEILKKKNKVFTLQSIPGKHNFYLPGLIFTGNFKKRIEFFCMQNISGKRDFHLPG